MDVSETARHLTSPPGHTREVKVDGAQMTVTATAPWGTATNTFPTALAPREIADKVLAVHTALDLAHFDQAFRYHDLPISQMHFVPVDENERIWTEMRLINNALGFVTADHINFDLDWQAHGDGFASVMIRWSSPDSTKGPDAADTFIDVCGMCATRTRWQIVQDVYKMLEWATAHETAEWVRNPDGTPVEDGHGRSPGRHGLVTLCSPLSRPWIENCKTLTVTAADNAMCR